MSLVSVTDLSKKFKITPYSVDRYLRVELLHIAKRIKNKRFLDRKSSEDTMRKILRLREKGFPLRMIDKVVNNKD